MNKFTSFAVLALSSVSVAAFANPPQGGFYNPQNGNPMPAQGGGFVDANQKISQVSDLAGMYDDQYVVLQGKIVQQVGKDDFLFRDKRGDVVIDVEGKAWRGQQIQPNDTVKIYGEVDRSYEKLEVEVHRIDKLK